MRLGLRAIFLLSKICMRSVMRLGQMVLNILLRTFWDSLMIRMRMQNRMRINKAG